jgi:uncharacterized coiled-coil protein SlyX
MTSPTDVTDEAALEIRRLELRLDALRRQLAERLETIRELREQLVEDSAPTATAAWRVRALEAEARYTALLDTRAFRLLQPARSRWERLRQRHPRLQR